MIALTSSGMVTLSARSETGATRRFDLHPDQGVFVGNSSNCGLQLPGEGIDDIHCRIGLEDGKLFVQSWMSADGIQVNGVAMSEKTEIGLGDVVRLGSHEISVDPSTAVTAASNEEHGLEAIVETDSDATKFEEPELQVQASSSHEFETQGHASADLGAGADHDAMGFGSDLFGSDEEEEVYDRETVELLRAEIEELQSALALRDADDHPQPHPSIGADGHRDDQATDEVLQRMQDLVDEANRSDERVALLEQMLHASEVANRSQQEERDQLEAWVNDIEQRVGQREAEHAAEVDALRARLEQASGQHDKLQKKIQQAAFAANAPQHYEETLENLQALNRELQAKLDQSEKERLAAEQQLQQRNSEHEHALREERASVAKERAAVSRLRFELSSQLSEIEELPKPKNQADRETAHRIQTLREHLREIHEQEKIAEKEAPLTTRLKKLWRRVEY